MFYEDDAKTVGNDRSSGQSFWTQKFTVQSWNKEVGLINSLDNWIANKFKVIWQIPSLSLWHSLHLFSLWHAILSEGKQFIFVCVSYLPGPLKCKCHGAGSLSTSHLNLQHLEVPGTSQPLHKYSLDNEYLGFYHQRVESKRFSLVLAQWRLAKMPSQEVLAFHHMRLQKLYYKVDGYKANSIFSEGGGTSSEVKVFN